MTQDPTLLSPIQIERLLELACAYDSPLSIHRESGEDVHRYKSRMLDVKKGPGPLAVIVEQPAPDGPAPALRPNTEATFFFATEQGRYSFDGKVLRKTEYDLGNRRIVSALEVTYPNMLKSGQRRAYYRVPVPLRMPIDIDCSIIDDAKRAKEDNRIVEPTEPPLRANLKARAVNISVGGILMAFVEGDAYLAGLGTKLAVKFSLAENETSLKLKAVVRRIEKNPATQQTNAAAEFIETDEAFECKLSINRLYRYVAERQRETLKSGTE
jgi:c-di-GMP-binding flagellar brake protein YcgR